MKKCSVFLGAIAAMMLSTACGHATISESQTDVQNEALIQTQTLVTSGSITDSLDFHEENNEDTKALNLKEYISYNLAQSEIETIQENINEQISYLKSVDVESIESVLLAVEKSKKECESILKQLKAIVVQMSTSNSLSPEIFALKTDLRMVLFYMEQFSMAKEKTSKDFQNIYAQLQAIEKSFGFTSYKFVQKIMNIEERIAQRNPELGELLLKYPLLSSEQMAMRAGFLEAQKNISLHVYDSYGADDAGFKNFANIVMTPEGQSPDSILYALPTASEDYCLSQEGENYCNGNSTGMMSLFEGFKTIYTLYQNDSQKVSKTPLAKLSVGFVDIPTQETDFLNSKEDDALYPGLAQALRGIYTDLPNDHLHVQAVCLEFSETYQTDDGMNNNQCFTVFGATKRQLL